jgi:transposase
VTRRDGRAAPGQRGRHQVPGARGGTGATLGARSLEGLRTALSVPGARDGATRLLFIEELWVATRNRGDSVLMDHTPIHTREDSAAAIEAVGAWGLFLPTDAPALNPIDNCWAKGNSIVRSLQPRTWPDVLDALVKAFSSITKQDLQGWFPHGGYRVAATCKSL